MSQKTEVKVFDYEQSTDTLNCEVNGERQEIAAELFFNQYQALEDNRAADFNKPQTPFEYCLGMIYEMHFDEEPADLCYTFYQVEH